MGGLEEDLFSSKFYLTGTEGSKKQGKKKKGRQWDREREKGRALQQGERHFQ